MSDILLRPPKPGDMGWVTHRHGVLYAAEYGWDERFEALVGRICADFVDNLQDGERCWIAERDGAVVGSVFMVRADDAAQKGTAKLRLLYVEPSTRGSGLGRRLVRAVIDHARAEGFARLVLWTNDCLHAARRIYEGEGFRLVSQEPHHSFGVDLVGQEWALQLTLPSRPA